MKIIKKITVTLAVFVATCMCLSLVLAVYPAQYIPVQEEIISALTSAKLSQNNFLIFTLAIFICVTAPVIEEVIFRLPLGNLNLLPWSIFCFASYFVAGLLLPFDLQNSYTMWLRPLWTLLMTYGLFSCCYKKIHLKSLCNFWEHRFLLILIFSTIFALLHIDWEQISGIISLTLFLFPYLFLGIVISLIRVRLGFWYGLAFHSLNNLLTFLLIYLH